jgi:hypothetical protein
MRPGELERRLRKRLDTLGPALRAELLRVLISRPCWLTPLRTSRASRLPQLFPSSPFTGEEAVPGPVCVASETAPSGGTGVTTPSAESNGQPLRKT